MKEKWKVLDPLYTVKVGRALWLIAKNIRFQTPRGIDTVPAGRLFDHASVPRIFSNIVPPVKSCIAEASVWHDEMYCKDTPFVTRLYADIGLRELTISKAKDSKKSDIAIAYLAYRAVRIFAGRLYDRQFNYEKMVDVYMEYQHMELAELQTALLTYNSIKEFIDGMEE